MNFYLVKDNAGGMIYFLDDSIIETMTTDVWMFRLFERASATVTFQTICAGTTTTCGTVPSLNCYLTGE